MKTSLLSSTKDPMGTAIADYYKQGKAAKLRVFSSQFEEDEIPVAQLFRSYEQMPPLEQKALQLAQGKILDCGAGSGCHALALQAMGKEVQAIDISPLSVETMRLRGVKQAYQVNLFDENYVEQFDTILLLMNGSGIIGKLANMSAFFNKMKQLLTPDGCIYMDSSDLRYLFEDEDGSFLIDLADDYYGEIDFQMQYKQIKGEPFDWLYIDFQTLSLYAAQNGFTAELIQEGEHYNYLARLKRQSH
ncbi:MAG: class I SAM-dependent methyltransferase [Parabacteroides sp.]|nr:class I SAM-dependent methyltransferase [Parabacteroides sp.]